MISGLCGFAEVVRRNGGEVGAAELIDAARAFTLIDLADRTAVERALRMSWSWATVQPDAFTELFAHWFAGDGLDESELGLPADDDLASISLDAETVDAARIHNEDELAIEDRRDDLGNATAKDGVESPNPSPGQPTSDGGAPVGAHGDVALAPPTDETTDADTREADLVVELPVLPPDADLELARGALASALERRRRASDLTFATNRVTALAEPLSRHEREQLARCARRINRRLQGAASWRRKAAVVGAIDMRRTLRRTVTTGGLPVDVRRTGRRADAARLVVLVDVSLSVRGTSRLVLHLVHRLRSSVGSLRAFGFVDAFVPIDRALRTADSVRAIEDILGSVDVQASSDPGRALRAWWSRWHYLVTPETHVVILSDGRCNGNDPAFDTVRKITARSASTLWISPEPQGAWSLGRGEMADYAACVDRAVTVRSVDDLDTIVAVPTRAR